MIKKLLIAAVFCFVVSMAQAAPYFRLIDMGHPQINAGTSIGANFVRQTTMVALITHSPADGYFLIPGLDWTPLAAGGGFKAKAFHLSAGPSMNMLPAIKSTLAAFVDAVTAPDKYSNLKSLLTPASSANGDIVGALGINLEYDFTAKVWSTPLFAGIRWKF
ncbi:MAG: hypothetical protein NTX59_08200 [Elusimicrobia bacterium]|nr:hypothetical protein [Elusimicrobiota bacterium]